MNGFASQGALWQEARAPDGRSYFFNTQTKETSWQKPQDLMSPVEKALTQQPWKEHTAPDGRKYYAHGETRQTVWEMPAQYREALEAAKSEALPPSTPTQPSLPAASTALSTYQPRDFSNGYDSRRETIAIPSVAKENVPDYSSFEEAEAAFMKLLKRSGVQPDWSWQQTMRATIKDAQYRALKDPKDRKAAFEKYVVDVRESEKERAKERIAKLRADFGKMLRAHPEIKHYSRWKTVRPNLEGESVFRSTDDEEERKQFFAEYILDLKKQNIEQETADRKSAVADLGSILHSLNLEPYTRWSQAQELIEANERIQKESKFKLLNKSDILAAFETHIKALERSSNDRRQQQKAQKLRRERRNRDAFIALLREKQSRGSIKAGTKWSHFLPKIEEDPRYVAMLGQSGSTPLELFWDVLEEEERALRGRRNDVYDVLEEQRYEVTSKTTYDEFIDIMSTDRRTSNLDKDILHLIFQRLQDKVQKRAEEEEHAADKRKRRAIDALRSRIKHLDPPVRISDTFADVLPRIEKTEEFQSLDEEGHKAAFDKYINRLREKEEDERERERRKARRIDDRDYRNGYHDRRRSRTSKTPEADPYEEDRKRAIAAREKQYRRSSIGHSPPRSSHRDGRERDERHGRLERSPPPRSITYDRERRERRDPDDERERLYRTRADPRGSRDELNYGEESKSVTSERRRRRESPGDSIDSPRRKRHRRDSKASPELPKTKLPEVKKDVEDLSGVHSGSEEGEIEED